jgi:hypothetical protein
VYLRLAVDAVWASALKEVHVNRNTVSFFVVLLLSSACLAQSSTDAQATGSVSPKISVPSGTTVQAELLKAIDARKSQPGDEVAAKITQDVKAGDKVVLTKGSKVMGKVTKAQGRAKGQDESELGLTFDSAVLKDGTQVRVSFAIQAVANTSAAIAQAALDAQGGANSISMANNAPGGGMAGRPGLGSQAQGAPGGDLHAGNAASSNTAAELTPDSQGAIGLPGLTLASGTLITSSSKNIRLEKDTRFVLKVSVQ